ncbi:hypothetical protein ACH9EU_17110 [Kocuria sp. M1R5S2]|uniref:hypothetical protein n=1 Tax=Kocuria rhizosphaerae TaxID=3376285 RepID=UPI003798EF76
MEPRQKGLVAGVVFGTAVWSMTGQILWIAVGTGCGVGVGWWVGRRRDRRTERRTPVRAPVGRADHRREETPEHRESRLRSAAMHNGGRMVEGRQLRGAALERMRGTVPGFPPERYEAELDNALARIDERRVEVLARRAQHVAEARELDMLNAVFALHYFNQRFSGHVGEYGLGRIDLVDALGDLYSREQINEAVTRADALIDDGQRCAYFSDDDGRQIRWLRQNHPGFVEAHLHRAADWGYMLNR